jgi:predicted outer membrane repeat protein
MLLRPSKRSRSHTRPSHRPGFRPTLEALETRLVPANITVQNPNDSGPGSLRAAIQQGNDSPDLSVNIDFAATVRGTITLESALQPLQKYFTITGPGASSLTIARDTTAGNFRLFNINDPSLSCDIENLTLASGNSTGVGSSGAIRNMADLQLTNCTLENNTSSSYGGAIYNAGTLALSGCTLQYNTATDRGGAIYNEESFDPKGNPVGGELNLNSGCDVACNSANYGGGIYNNAPDGSVTIGGNTSFVGNGAFQGGGIFNQAGPLQMNGGYLNGNEANISSTVPVEGSGRGGGYYGYGGSATFQGVAFNGNSADNRGGGFYLKAGTLNLNTCSIGTTTANTAPTGPGGYIELGATYTTVNCTINDVVVRET